MFNLSGAAVEVLFLFLLYFIKKCTLYSLFCLYRYSEVVSNVDIGFTAHTFTPAAISPTRVDP